MPLLVLARRAFVAQRHMASRAEACDVARLAAAFRAFHKLSLRAPASGCGRAYRACAHPVNTGCAVRRREGAFEHVVSAMWSAGACSRFRFAGACHGGLARRIGPAQSGAKLVAAGRRRSARCSKPRIETRGAAQSSPALRVAARPSKLERQTVAARRRTPHDGPDFPGGVQGKSLVASRHTTSRTHELHTASESRRVSRES
jgi:hypothetical protein